MGIGGDLLQTVKYGMSMYSSRKGDLISSGGSKILLLVLISVVIVARQFGVGSNLDLAQISGITLLIAGMDTGTLLTFSYFFDPLIGDVFGMFGLRAVLTLVAVLTLPGWMISYFRGIRKDS